MNHHIEFIQPFGALINNKQSESLNTFSPDELLALVKQHALMIIRNMHAEDKDSLLSYAKTLGELLAWEFGEVMEMRAEEKPKNYLFTHGEVPLHWDGAFHRAPRYLLFHCLQAPLKSAGGETFFCHTGRLLNVATQQEKKQWETLSLTYATEKLVHYGGEVAERLVQSHPDTKEKILRFAEPVLPPQLNPVSVRVNAMSSIESEDFIKSLAKRCYQTEYLYQHTWQDGDILMADNAVLLHGRRAFLQFSPRHLRRIQIL
jgi:alpha-ketoglutarate-dependent taurine dioxygenase